MERIHGVGEENHSLNNIKEISVAEKEKDRKMANSLKWSFVTMFVAVILLCCLGTTRQVISLRDSSLNRSLIKLQIQKLELEIEKLKSEVR